MNAFDELRQIIISLPYEQARKLAKFRYILLAAEDLAKDVENLRIPASLFDEQCVKNLFFSKDRLVELFNHKS